jgi:hypothetical protein
MRTASSLRWAASAPRWRSSHIKISLVVCNRVRAAPPGEPLVLPPNCVDRTAERVGTVVVNGAASAPRVAASGEGPGRGAGGL